MKRTMLRLMLCSALIPALSSCSNSTDNNHDDSVETADKINEQKEEAPATNAVAEDDAEFAVFTANAGMTEIEAAKMAEGKSSNQSVKDFAAMMLKDHEAAAEKLKGIAAARNITLPAAVADEQRKQLDDLSKKSGKDFDKAYADMMVSDHDKVVDKFKKASADLKDADLKSFATATLPTLQQHLDHAKMMKDKLK